MPVLRSIPTVSLEGLGILTSNDKFSLNTNYFL